MHTSTVDGEGFNSARWRRDAGIVAAVTVAGLLVALAVFEAVNTTEVDAVVFWSVLVAAVAVMIIAFLRGSLGGAIGVAFLAVVVVNVVLGFAVLAVTGSELGFYGAFVLIFAALAVIPGATVWSLIDLMRSPRIRSWQRSRYSNATA